MLLMALIAAHWIAPSRLFLVLLVLDKCKVIYLEGGSISTQAYKLVHVPV